MFVDQVRIHAKAGDGGRGCVSFLREKFKPKGGPDGGDGGDGGDVILRADEHTDNLVALYYEPLVRARNGGPGLGKKKHGKSAPDTVVKVPVGTLVYRLPDEFAPNRPPERFDDEGNPVKPELNPSELDVIADLVAIGQEAVLCRGGGGGRGNVHFKSSRNRVPRQAKPGEPGEEGAFLLELRRIADVGLVGFPNAGKSTLLGALSAAHPKVAAYPFTTLHPHLGIVELGGYQRLVVADIPGLIDGAHRNAGLGHEFLRHIVRCRSLAFVVDLAGTDGRDPVADLGSLRREITLYDPALARKPWFIIGNKMDLAGADVGLGAVGSAFPGRGVVAISAATGSGLDVLLERLREVAGTVDAGPAGGEAGRLAGESGGDPEIWSFPEDARVDNTG